MMAMTTKSSMSVNAGREPMPREQQQVSRERRAVIRSSPMQILGPPPHPQQPHSSHPSRSVTSASNTVERGGGRD